VGHLSLASRIAFNAAAAGHSLIPKPPLKLSTCRSSRLLDRSRSPFHIAFHFGAMHVLKIVKPIVADRSAEGAALALGMLDAEIEDSTQAHAVAIQ
jgi:hypothetical protein